MRRLVNELAGPSSGKARLFSWLSSRRRHWLERRCGRGRSRLRRGLRLDQPPQQPTAGRRRLLWVYRLGSLAFGPPLGHLAEQSANEIDDRLGSRIGLHVGRQCRFDLVGRRWCAGLLTGIGVGPIAARNGSWYGSGSGSWLCCIRRRCFGIPASRGVGLPGRSRRCRRPWWTDRLSRRLRPAGAAQPIDELSHHPARIGPQRTIKIDAGFAEHATNAHGERSPRKGRQQRPVLRQVGRNRPAHA